jgi:hypothetical protein
MCELVSDWAAIRPDSNTNVTGSIHFVLFINCLLEIGKLGEELLFGSPQSEAILNQLAGNVHGGSLKRYELM